MSKVQIIDAIMGSGKTYDAITRMKSYIKNDSKFIYITPFRNEIVRVIKDLPQGSVSTPLRREDNNGQDIYEITHDLVKENGMFVVKTGKTKMNMRTQFLKMADQGKNIISTHSLFMNLKKNDFDLFGDYILILDEVVNPLSVENIGSKDIQIMKDQNLIMIDEDTNEVRFIDDEYSDNAFKRIKILCGNSTVFFMDKYFFVWVFPIEIFKEFKEVQILTYLFSGSLMAAYFKLYDIEYELISKDHSQELLKIKGLLNIYDGVANQKRDKKSKRSRYCMTWSENVSKITAKKISNATAHIFKKHFKTKSEENAFTTFKSCKNKFSGPGYARGFISINARATNDFKHKRSMAYLGNRYFDVQTANFFKIRGIKMDEEIWALSELVQWVWRGCIREGKEMNLYIPSIRMRELLINWLDGKYIDAVKETDNDAQSVDKISA